MTPHGDRTGLLSAPCLAAALRGCMEGVHGRQRRTDPPGGRQAAEHGGAQAPRPSRLTDPRQGARARQAAIRALLRGPSPAAVGHLPGIPPRGPLAPRRLPGSHSLLTVSGAARPVGPGRSRGAGKGRGRYVEGRAGRSSLSRGYLSAHGLSARPPALRLPAPYPPRLRPP